MGIALEFGTEKLSLDGSNIGVFWLFEHGPGDSGGRDITALSAVTRESEIMIMADSPFTIRSKVKVGGANQPMAGAIAGYYQALSQNPIAGVAGEVYIVHAVADR